jgi:hypothetical protein
MSASVFASRLAFIDAGVCYWNFASFESYRGHGFLLCRSHVMVGAPRVLPVCFLLFGLVLAVHDHPFVDRRRMRTGLGLASRAFCHSMIWLPIHPRARPESVIFIGAGIVPF